MEETPFNEVRLNLLEAFVAELGLTMLQVVQEYNHNSEFKRRIDLAAFSMSMPTSQAIH
jgi:hypothetical protein